MRLIMAGTVGFDPTTGRLTGDCSTGLSYIPKSIRFLITDKRSQL